MMSPPVVHIVGRKRTGKTDLITKLINLLVAKGYRVGGVRHSPHAHQLDAGGTDTEAFRKAGALGSALVSSDEMDLFLPSTAYDEKFSRIKRAFYDCHIILVEGGLRHSREKIEIVPKGEKPLSQGDPSLRAVVNDGSSDAGLPWFRLAEPGKICAFIEDRYLKPNISGAIMAGGKSSRFGRNKALLKINGKTIIEFVLEAISNVITDLKIITNTPAEYQYLGVTTATDIRPGCGPLSGVHTALTTSATEYVFIVSCDLPLLSPDTLSPLLSTYPGSDITIYKHIQFEPLCAIYRRTCLPTMEDLMDHGEYRIIDLCASLHTKVIRTAYSPAFQGINTREDYQRVLEQLTGDPPQS